MQLSVVIITLNEEKNIERCLQSVKNIADEIVVVDSYSTDNTIPIAKSYGARIVLQQFRGYVKQRQLADEHASFNWVFAIDADEEISAELEKSILEIKAQPAFHAYRLPRLNSYCGQWIKHAGWYPDKKIRLFDKTKGNWHGEMVHEQWKLTDTNAPIGELKGDLLHYTYYTISNHIKQIEKFTELSAQVAAAKGKNCSLLKIWIGPKWTFISMYIFRLGFLDGYYGYLLCKLSASATLIKYSKIRQYHKMRKG